MNRVHFVVAASLTMSVFYALSGALAVLYILCSRMASYSHTHQLLVSWLWGHTDTDQSHAEKDYQHFTEWTKLYNNWHNSFDSFCPRLASSLIRICITEDVRLSSVIRHLNNLTLFLQHDLSPCQECAMRIQARSAVAISAAVGLRVGLPRHVHNQFFVHIVYYHRSPPLAGFSALARGQLR